MPDKPRFRTSWLAKSTQPTLSIFLSYAKVDRLQVGELYDWLVRLGFNVWMADRNLAAGEDWVDEITRAMRVADLFIFCLSAAALNKTGYLHREIRFALDIADEKPKGFVIPVRLEECSVPPALAQYQWINLYEPEGKTSLLSSLYTKTEARHVDIYDIRVRYHLDNVTSLLLQEISIEDLRKLLYDLPTPSARSLFRDTNSLSSKFEIVSVALDTLRSDDIDWLLAWFKGHRFEAYHRHSPYRKDERTRRVSARRQAPAASGATLDNPYVVGNPVQPENMRVFLGRFDIAKAILGEVQKGVQRPSMLLYGRRRMGKTSALLNMGRLMQDMRLVHIYISGQSAKYHNNLNFCFYVAKSLQDQLEQEGIDITVLLNARFRDRTTFGSNPVLRLSEFFSACNRLLEMRDMHCLLAIDEYEEIDRHIDPGAFGDKGITRDLLLQLRDTMQHNPRFIFLFAGTHFLRDLSKVDWTSIFINVKTMHISFLEREDSTALLTRPVPEMTYESPALVERILFLTGCQPLLLQAMASEIINVLNLRATRVVTPHVLNAAIRVCLRARIPILTIFGMSSVIAQIENAC